jgi:hypothetical protein
VQLAIIPGAARTVFACGAARLTPAPVAFTLAGFIGLAVTSAAQTLYGELLWDPLKLIDVRAPPPAPFPGPRTGLMSAQRFENRAARFFAALAFVLATLGTNISANSLVRARAPARRPADERARAVGRERPRGARAALDRHPARAAAVRADRRLGALPVGDPREVRRRRRYLPVWRSGAPDARAARRASSRS